MQQKKSGSFFEDLVIRGTVWSLIGVLFGTLFIVVLEMLRDQLAFAPGLVLAITGAAAITSLFYGSMRLTVLVANVTFVAMLIYVWQSGSLQDLHVLILIGAGVGMTIGTVYGWTDKASRVFCADAKIVTALVAGVCSGLLALLLQWMIDGLPLSMLAMLVAPFGIVLYITLAGWFVTHCHQMLPDAVDGMLVGLGVGSVTGLLFVIMAGSFDSSLLDSDFLQGLVLRIEGYWSATVLACAGACFAVGALRSMMRVRWYQL